MSPAHRNNPDQSEPTVPERLKTDLVRLYEMDVTVPAELDKRILTMARERLRRSQPVRRRVLSMRILRWALPAAAAAAAAVLLLMWTGSLPVPYHSEPDTAVLTTRQDIDRNGRVDILDAFALARHIETSGASGDQWDVNGDGEVNQGDVKTIAMAAVSLNPGAVQ